jgi:hypothetical protein
MAEKAKQGKAKLEGDSGSSAIDTSGTTDTTTSSSKDKMPSQRPRTLSNEDMDKMAPEQLFRTSLNEHGEVIQEDEPAVAEGRKPGSKDEGDDLDLYDAMTAE